MRSFPPPMKKKGIIILGVFFSKCNSEGLEKTGKHYPPENPKKVSSLRHGMRWRERKKTARYLYIHKTLSSLPMYFLFIYQLVQGHFHNMFQLATSGQWPGRNTSGT